MEETIKRLQSHKGVQGIVVVNSEGIPIRSTLDNALTVQYSALITQLSAKAKSVVRDLDPQVYISPFCKSPMTALADEPPASGTDQAGRRDTDAGCDGADRMTLPF